MNRDVTLEVDGLRLDGRLYLPGDSDCGPYPAVCICHGIPAERYDPAGDSYPRLVERVCGEGIAALTVKFRGAGTSEGDIDLPGWTKDLAAAIDYLAAQPEVDSSRLGLLGFSGGAAVSIYVAAMDERISAVASCASPAEFASLVGDEKPEDIIKRMRDIGAIRDKDFPPSVEEWHEGFRSFSPVESVAGISPRALLLVHGSEDDMVSVSHVYRLYDRAGEPKEMVVIDGAGHRLKQEDRAMAIVLDWLKSRLRSIDLRQGNAL